MTERTDLPTSNGTMSIMSHKEDCTDQLCRGCLPRKGQPQADTPRNETSEVSPGYLAGHRRTPGPIKTTPELDARAEEWALREARLWDVNPMAQGLGACFLKRGYIRGWLDRKEGDKARGEKVILWIFMLASAAVAIVGIAGIVFVGTQ